MAVLRREAKKRLERPRLTLLLSIALAVALGVVVYVVTSTLPYLAMSPTTDPNFGNQNHCLLTAIPADRTGFAVFGAEAVAYSGTRLARCAAKGPAKIYEITGITRASFDFKGALWFSRRSETNTPPELWRVAEGLPERVGEVTPVGLVGTAFGVVTIDSQGRLVSLDSERMVLGVAQLPAAPPSEVQLTVSADGNRIALVTSGGLFVYGARRLENVLAESPCEVEFLWWRKETHRVLVSCGPDADWALEVDVNSSERETAPRFARTASQLVPRSALYVQECEHLPCTASPP